MNISKNAYDGKTLKKTASTCLLSQIDYTHYGRTQCEVFPIQASPALEHSCYWYGPNHSLNEYPKSC